MPKLVFQSSNDKQKGKLEYFLKILSDKLSITEDGGISLGTDGKYETSTAGIFNALENRLLKYSEFDETEMLYFIKQSVHQCVRDGDFSIQHFMKVLFSQIRIARAVPEEPYVLYTPISINARYPEHDLNGIRFGDAHLTFSKYLPERFTFPEKIEKLLNDEDDYKKVFPDKFYHLRVHVKAHSPRKAFDQALLRADEIRAIWNLALNYKMDRFFFNSRKPYNEIVYGPFHTLHLESGKSAIGGFWKNETWCDSVRAYRLNDSTYGKLKHFEQFARKGLKKCLFRKDIEIALVLYVRALDEPNPMTSVQKLWSVLEIMTGKLRKNDDVIRRATFHSIDRKYHKEQLDIIRKARNRLVHDGEEKDDQYALHYVRKLKMSIDHLLVFLLKHGSKFSSLYDFGWYLALPVEKQLIRRRISYMGLAQEILWKEK